MKILLVTQEYPPETGWGGIGTYNEMLARGLTAQGCEVHVLSIAAGIPAGDTATPAAVVHRRELMQIRGIGRIAGLPFSYESLCLAFSVDVAMKKLHREHSFDIVEFPNWKAEGFFFLLHPYIPSSMRVHSMGIQLFPHMGMSRADARFATWLEEATIKKVGVAHAPTRHITMTAERLGLSEGRYAAIPAPVDLPPDPGPPATQPARILFAGRFEPRKNPETILRAAPAVLARFPDTRFIFVGRDSSAGGHDSYLAWLRSICRESQITDAVTFIDGWQPDSVKEQMPLALVVVVPSLSESFGYVAAEAAAYGRASVVSRVDGLSQLVVEGVTGFTAGASDPSEWADAMNRLLEDRDGALKMGASARRFAEDNLSAKVIAGKMLAVYEEAISRFTSKVR